MREGFTLINRDVESDEVANLICSECGEQIKGIRSYGSGLPIKKMVCGCDPAIKTFEIPFVDNVSED